MTKHEIHLRFMEAAMKGLLPKLPLVDQTGEHGIKVPDKIAHNREIAESCCALADAALEAYLSRWPDVKFED